MVCEHVIGVRKLTGGKVGLAQMMTFLQDFREQLKHHEGQNFTKFNTQENSR